MILYGYPARHGAQTEVRRPRLTRRVRRPWAFAGNTKGEIDLGLLNLAKGVVLFWRLLVRRGRLTHVIGLPSVGTLEPSGMGRAISRAFLSGARMVGTYCAAFEGQP